MELNNRTLKNLEKPQGLYRPEYHKNSCGVGFVADFTGKKSNHIVRLGLQVIKKLEHRGAVGADPETGDGAGIQIQIPDKFFRKVIENEKLQIQLPDYGRYAVGFFYMPRRRSLREKVQNIIEKVVLDEGQIFLGWREVPINEQYCGELAKKTLPFFMQAFVEANENIQDQMEFERKLFLIRRVIDRRIRAELKLDRSQYYVPSFSSRTINYKGMLKADQLINFYPDITDPDIESAYTMIHMRFSTNTLPTWDLAQPFRMIAHNGEINTLRGNVNWMEARQMVMASKYFGKDLKRMLPIIMVGQSDSATFDSVAELLYMGGRSLPHAIMMMIPEAWSKNPDIDEDKKAFYEYHAMLLEPWDGPAAIVFSDGNVIGATLDRNGLRPARYIVTKDNIVIMASEVGVIPVEPERIVKSGRLQPGKMFFIDLNEGRIVEDEEIKHRIVKQKPYKEWIKKYTIRLEELPDPPFIPQPDHSTVVERQRIFGYTTEDVYQTMKPMAEKGEEPTGAMGDDVSLAILSSEPQPLFRYFKQVFAQVTNPPIDPIREEIVMDLTSYLGPEGNLLDEKPEYAHRIELKNPILTNNELEKIRSISIGKFKTITINILFDPDQKHGMRNRLDQICDEAAQAIRKGYNIIILSDRGVARNMAPIPSLLATAGVHHFLIRAGLRTKTSIIVESGEPREVAHFAMLIGYGANAINPYLAFETIYDLVKQGILGEIRDFREARKNYIKAIQKGLLKIFSKMGISTLQSYCGAQIYEAVGLDSELVNLYFTGTPTHIEGLSLEMLEEETVRRHRKAFDKNLIPGQLHVGGIHYWRKYSESHLLTPMTIFKLQQAAIRNDYDLYKEFSRDIYEGNKDKITLRSLFELDYSEPPVPIEEVEPEESILKRFHTGAMSFGALSWEAHVNIAIAMNRIGGKSNSGEGGEDPIRYKPLPNGDSMNSAIKQVASGRFGVTTNYLVNASDIQIKIAQGAKPGEGGQLPGFKVDKIIAKIRHSTPGVTLISPPPHHDIYSIEDLAQLIFDLKNVNPTARISVKLVSCVGVGTIAAGVAKAHADHILISGHDGGTGASPISSIHYAGTPWEIGLSETQQTLLIQGLRDRVVLATDGKMMNGLDVVYAALLGAEEFGFATSAMIVMGCIMMRKCHLNTCPVGVATQNPILRKKFTGKPEYLINYLYFVAREVREYMAKLGYRTMNEMIGQVHRIKFNKPRDHWKARGIYMGNILRKVTPYPNTQLYCTKKQDHGLEKQLDYKIMDKIKDAIENFNPVELHLDINNENRAFGTIISGEIARRYGNEGLPEDTIKIYLRGYAGQSFGAFLTKGVTLHLKGQANDYVGKGLSGGKIIIQTPEESELDPSENIIIGNTCFYGATSGEAYINGVAGERFAVRNSGVYAVVEGVGDHGCEYMTAGRVIILGKTGRNFAAGMSGGIAYVWDPEKVFERNVNLSMVDIEELINPKEIEFVKNMLTKHYQYTKSKRAKEILDNWENEIGNFVKVMPGDYKLALQKLEEEELSGLKEKEEEIEEVLHG
ncbi:MAG: glutamate synthase large subunit [Leptospiraceae bacterium]|nr:glutamate synthase large subunit [Leptospiraceae bacterium]MDW7976876.1 glutamate synthase large subunit [Leptospiraceae bacterium]